MAEDEAYKDSERVVTITYSSSEILDNLLNWYPAYIGLGKSAKAKASDATTTYCYQATVWHVLTSVKTAKFAMPMTDPAWKLLHIKDDEFAPSSKEKESRLAKFKAACRTFSEEQREAHQVLRQLSRCWKSVDTSEADIRDALPKELS